MPATCCSSGGVDELFVVALVYRAAGPVTHWAGVISYVERYTTMLLELMVEHMVMYSELCHYVCL
jgi:hypothetical protein